VVFQEIALARDPLPVPPWPTTRRPTGPDRPPFYPALIWTARIRAILPLRLHLSWSAVVGLDERRWGQRHLRGLLVDLLTGSAGRFVEESKPWFRVAEALLDPLGGRGRRLERRKALPVPHPVRGQAQPEDQDRRNSWTGR
jgi:hypothetical protein